MVELNRHQTRQAAFQTLFGLSANPDVQTEVLAAQVLAGDPELTWEGELPSDLLALVNGVTEHLDELDLTISGYLQSGWTIDRISQPDLGLIRLALYEAKYGNIDAKIAVNEAMELAKNFTDDKGRKFINGLLNKALTF
ncbi:transcription antitermination factor NusB [Weissella oryzae SG25]|uniref:Transcription antitermination protein NusB n=1 Tax=Weissella oryzae (strain DSM 25784 / JCM 18191 / LMG 30913 / SG25) TaxID=1329250 RepID=A0A069CVR0_WEIOS|nr:transcription antitermination factor NusB [Weissella oryzae]GAK31482.1 transcription antitermination factor NusB [Weissella oryzae SG25]